MVLRTNSPPKTNALQSCTISTYHENVHHAILKLHVGFELNKTYLGALESLVNR